MHANGWGTRASAWGQRKWALGIVGSGLFVAACAGGKSDEVDSLPSEPDVFSEAGSQQPSDTTTSDPGSDDEPVNPMPNTTESDETLSDSIGPDAPDVAEAGANPGASGPSAETSSPVQTDTPPIDSSAPPAATDSAPIDVSTPEFDAGSDVMPPQPAPEVDAGVGVPNVPTEFEVSPPMCVDGVGDMSPGRCTMARTCGEDPQVWVSCDSTVEDWRCRCINGQYDLKFTDTDVLAACTAGLSLCDYERAPSLGSWVCDPPMENSTASSCWYYRECSYHWELQDVIADSIPSLQGAACSIDTDTQRWQCECLTEGQAWTSFAPLEPVDGDCGSMFDLCQKFDTLVPEIGADCTEIGNSVTHDENEEWCTRELECEFRGNVDGTRIDASASINLQCDLVDGEITCYVNRPGNANTTFMSPIQDLDEACLAFTHDELVGLASLPVLHPE